MKKENPNDGTNCRNRSGIVLLVTLVVLVVLSTLAYTLTSRVSAQRHRDQYIIDYQAACYGCDSAVKYALATLENINPQLVARPNEPDFSDLFNLSELEYEEILAQWAVEKAIEEGYEDFDDIGDFDNANDANDVNDVNNVVRNKIGISDFNDSDSLTIPGPYGPPWPFVTKPAEFKIGSATVRIEIEDENAKYPIAWAMLGDNDNDEEENKQLQRQALAGFETFCEWMDVNEVQIDSLKQQLKEISEIKPFKLDFKAVSKKVPAKAKLTKAKSTKGKAMISAGTGAKKGRERRRPSKFDTITISASEQMAEQAVDFAKLFHSSLIDTEVLARPTIVSESRKESTLKYMGMWASSKVNINTAPRHVLEAAFVFGGNEVGIAEEIIQRRRIKPFEDIADLKKSLFGYSNSIEKCEKYITTASKFFTIKVTATSGVAEASAVIAITKDGNRVKRIAIISG